MPNAVRAVSSAFWPVWYDFSCTTTGPLLNDLFMKKSAFDRELLSLLVSAYNQSIQTYYYFPEIVICGQQRLDRDSFDRLLAEEFVVAFSADSFGKNYRLSKKGEAFLLTSSFRSRSKKLQSLLLPGQGSFSFTEAVR